MKLWDMLFGSTSKNNSPAEPNEGVCWHGKDLLEFDRLTEVAKNHAKAYDAALPFPHTVMDGFLNEALTAAVAAEFPARTDNAAWLDYNGSEAGKPVQHRKYHISDEQFLGPVTQRLLYELKSARFLSILSELTGIENLIPDALNHGGGIHMSCSGAMLKIHADFNRHPEWQLDRRLNLLIYLNSDWQHSFGGDLELWDERMQSCQTKVSPVAGRCVIFSTSSTSYHGHPDPINCPDDVTRKSIALYYYTAPRRQDSGVVHSTLWQTRPGSSEE